MIKSTLISIALLRIAPSAFAIDPSCNEMLSGYSSEIAASIHELAKLRFDLDQRLALGESGVVTRAMQVQYAMKEAEVLAAAQIAREVLVAKVRIEIESIQGKVRLDETQRVQVKETEQREKLDSETRITQIGSLKSSRRDPTQSVLSDGRVLIVSGTHSSGYLDTIEVIDSKTGESKIVGALKKPRRYHTQSVLSDDRVIV